MNAMRRPSGAIEISPIVPSIAATFVIAPPSAGTRYSSERGGS